MNTTTPHAGQAADSRLAARRPITLLLVPAVTLTLGTQAVSLLNGWSVIPAKTLELLLLLGGATLVAALGGGRHAVRRLFRGLTRWRVRPPTWFLVAGALPLTSVVLAVFTGTLSRDHGSWVQTTLLYLLYLVFGALTANLWEETVWGGFVQARLMARHGLLVGSLLTAVPFFVIHLPLAYETDGWSGTSVHDALITWAFLLVSAPFFRYLIGTVLIDTGGSVLAAGILHASFNASGALPVLSGGWQYAPAMIALTLVVAVVRKVRGRSFIHGSAPALLQDPTYRPRRLIRHSPIEPRHEDSRRRCRSRLRRMRTERRRHGKLDCATRSPDS